jgi:hypothetical protein
MPMTSSQLSKLRQQLSRSFATLGRLFAELVRATPMVPGSLYRLRRKCGKPTCRCAQGELHETWVLSRSEQGKSRLYTVPAPDRAAVREWSAQYRRYQRARAQWVKRCTALLVQMDHLAEQRIVPWPPRSEQNPSNDESDHHRTSPSTGP